jgi:hypothetical protein
MNGRCLHSLNLLPKEGGERFKLFTLHPQKISSFITQSMFCHHYYYHFLSIIFLNHATSASSAIVNIR